MPRVALICDTRRCAREGRIGDKVGFRILRTRMLALRAFNGSCKSTKEAHNRQYSFYCRNAITMAIFDAWQEALSRCKSS